MAQQQDTVILDCPAEGLLEAVTQALELIGASIEAVDEQAKTVAAITKGSFASWAGESLSIWVMALNPSQTAVRIESQCRWPTAADVDKNYQNIRAFFDALRELLGNPPEVQPTPLTRPRQPGPLG